jgi:hypothetical protein
MFPDGPGCGAERDFVAFAESLSFQLRQESRKVFAQLLHGFPNHPELSRLRASLENTQGLLTSFLQQTVVSLVQIVLPEVRGKDLYQDFTSRLEQSVRLREDMWVFQELLTFVSSVLGASDRSAVQRDRAVFALVQYLDTFEKGSLPNVRLSDLEEFERFFDRVRSLDAEPLASPSHLDELTRNIEVFRIYVQTSMELIGNRAELQDLPFDPAGPRQTLDRFLDLAGAGPESHAP